jgi:hypothetical protein
MKNKAAIFLKLNLLSPEKDTFTLKKRDKNHPKTKKHPNFQQRKKESFPLV